MDENKNEDGGGIPVQETPSVADKAESEPTKSLLVELKMYKQLYYKTARDFRNFTVSVDKTIGSCQLEMETTIDALLESHKNRMEELRMEKLRVESELQESRREKVDLECKFRLQEAEVAQLRIQLEEKWAAAQLHHMDDMTLKSKYHGLNDAQNSLFEHMATAEQKNEMYKAQISDLERENLRLVATIAAMSEEHMKDVNALKAQLDLAENEAREQRDALNSMISELTVALESHSCKHTEFQTLLQKW